ncbi:sensor histidine kinase [Paenibacillus ferrarius]|uniref:sensor histidine kinase n=1 Tax=Paenibacillus ferrarius TaxID=1469647 RepID=UPI003D2A7862
MSGGRRLVSQYRYFLLCLLLLGMFSSILQTMRLSALTGVILVGPVSYVNVIYDWFIFPGLYLFTCAWFIWTVAKMPLREKREPDVPYLLITGISIISNLAWSILKTVMEITSVFYPIDLLIAVSAFSLYGFKKYLRNSDEIVTPHSPVPNKLPNLLKDAPVHILAVDDDAINLNVLTGILSADSYHVVTTRTGEAALNLLTTQNWDLLIADVMIPGMSGYELTQRVRERYNLSELPILLLTARNQPEDIYTGFLSGANDYVVKPADAVELRYRIRALISLKQSMDDRLKIEASYLQAQIQPHFLFNTINSLMVLSEIDQEKMRNLGEAFTSFLRVSFDYLNSGELVDLAHELELVEAYLYIEKERFQEKLDVILNIDPELHLFLPPLSIQPLVENAVRHGAMGRVTGGTVQLKVVREAAGVEVEVRDNGPGLPPDKAAELLNPAFREKGRIGLDNTNRKLIRHYGQGLSIVSRPGEGTTVSFVIPVK